MFQKYILFKTHGDLDMIFRNISNLMYTNVINYNVYKCLPVFTISFNSCLFVSKTRPKIEVWKYWVWIIQTLNVCVFKAEFEL